MLKAFTRNYEDNSTDAGFQFTFYCDICNDGFKSSFIESTTYRKGSTLRGLGRGAGLLGSLIGTGNLGWNMERSADILSERFEGQSPEWQREHEAAFNAAQQEAKKYFHRCHSCHSWVCTADFNEEQGMCVECAPRENIAIAKARAQAFQRNLDDLAETTTVYTGGLEQKTTVCPACGAPAGSGKFCNNCGAPLALNRCANCGAEVAKGVKFCQECGKPMEAPPLPKKLFCPECGAEQTPRAKFCSGCGHKFE